MKTLLEDISSRTLTKNESLEKSKYNIYIYYLIIIKINFLFFKKNLS